MKNFKIAAVSLVILLIMTMMLGTIHNLVNITDSLKQANTEMILKIDNAQKELHDANQRITQMQEEIEGLSSKIPN